MRSWPLQAPVYVGAADATWGGVFTGFVEATHWPWNGSISRAWAADCMDM